MVFGYVLHSKNRMLQEKDHFSKVFSYRLNIELSRPAVRSPAATQFTFPTPHYKPGVPGSASTTCYAVFSISYRSRGIPA